jgi:hypothetical protein
MVAFWSAFCFSSCRSLVSSACAAGSFGGFELATEETEAGAVPRADTGPEEEGVAEMLGFRAGRSPPTEGPTVDSRLAWAGGCVVVFAATTLDEGLDVCDGGLGTPPGAGDRVWPSACRACIGLLAWPKVEGRDGGRAGGFVGDLVPLSMLDGRGLVGAAGLAAGGLEGGRVGGFDGVLGNAGAGEEITCVMSACLVKMPCNGAQSK